MKPVFYAETQEAEKPSVGDKQEQTQLSKCLSIACRHHNQTTKHFTTVLKEPHLRLHLSSVLKQLKYTEVEDRSIGLKKEQK